MGAGLSKKQLYGRQYRLLQRHMGTLGRAGAVGLRYKNLKVYGCFGGEVFVLRYNVLRASNGEVAGILACESKADGISEQVINIIMRG